MKQHDVALPFQILKFSFANAFFDSCDFNLHLKQPIIQLAGSSWYFLLTHNEDLAVKYFSLYWPTGPIKSLSRNIHELSLCAIAENLFPGGLETSGRRAYY